MVGNVKWKNKERMTEHNFTNTISFTDLECLRFIMYTISLISQSTASLKKRCFQ